MNINCKLFRLGCYQDHKVTGCAPVRRFSFVTYPSRDNDGRQWNASLTLGLTTVYFKVRYQSAKARSQVDNYIARVRAVLSQMDVPAKRREK